MSAVTAPQVNSVDASNHDDGDGPWWKDREVLLPVLSGIAFLTGLLCGLFAVRGE